MPATDGTDRDKEIHRMEKKLPVKPKSSSVQSVERAILLLETLAQENGDLSLTQIAGKLGWPKSTVHGLLATLRDHHYVDQSPETGRYRLGVRLFELGTQVARSWVIRDAAKPVMMRLSREFGETVQLGTEDDGEILYLDKLVSNSLVSILSDVGLRLPMHCSALGKVLLAHKTPAEVKRIVAQRGLAAMTKRTITSEAKLNRELNQVRERGFAIDDGEIMEGLCCVAAPIWDGNGQVRYAVSISGQARSMVGERFERITEELLLAAKEISYAMGARRN